MTKAAAKNPTTLDLIVVAHTKITGGVAAALADEELRRQVLVRTKDKRHAVTA